MNNRFLNNSDYLSIITDEALKQLIRNNNERMEMAEEAAEASIVEYLTDNYEIEKEILLGKNLVEYMPEMTYPVGAHFYYNGKIYEAIRSIVGLKKPSCTVYWKELSGHELHKAEKAVKYLQLKNWQPGDVVQYNGNYFECVEPNGYDFHDIRIPGIDGWREVSGVSEWIPNNDTYSQWSVVSYNGKFYTLINIDGIDLTVNPHLSNNWGMIGDYDPTYQYTNSETDYAVYKNKVFYPIMKVVNDKVEEGYNIRRNDPRNSNIKKHMVRLALYELHKLISPNNVSSARIADYEASMMWLRDANKCKINPQIPRKLDNEHKPVAEYAVATYMRDYDPYKNPWQI